MHPHTITLILMALGPAMGFAASKAAFYLHSKPITKIEAVKALLNDPKAPVTKCNDVELSDKLTLKNRKD